MYAFAGKLFRLLGALQLDGKPTFASPGPKPRNLSAWTAKETRLVVGSPVFGNQKQVPPAGSAICRFRLFRSGDRSRAVLTASESLQLILTCLDLSQSIKGCNEKQLYDRRKSQAKVWQTRTQVAGPRTSAWRNESTSSQDSRCSSIPRAQCAPRYGTGFITCNRAHIKLVGIHAHD